MLRGTSQVLNKITKYDREKLNGTIVKLKNKYIKQYTINNIKQMN